MREYKPAAGMTIWDAVADLVEMANQHGEAVKMTFNGSEAIAEPGANPAVVHNLWSTDRERRHQEYLRSPEGKRAARQQKRRERNAQRAIDAAMATLPTLDFGDLDALIGFFEQIDETADMIGIDFNRPLIVSTFMEHGFLPNANVKEDFNEEDRENYARYIIGQGLEGLMRFGQPVPPGALTAFAEKWREKFAPSSSAC